MKTILINSPREKTFALSLVGEIEPDGKMEAINMNVQMKTNLIEMYERVLPGELEAQVMNLVKILDI